MQQQSHKADYLLDGTCENFSLKILHFLQGLDWYKARLKTDKDGDLADEFLLEPNVGGAQPPDKPLKVSTALFNKISRPETQQLLFAMQSCQLHQHLEWVRRLPRVIYPW